MFQVKRAAECFFEGIAHLKPDELEHLKEELQGYTMVGVYLGDYEIQQIIRYPRSGMYFYTLMPNNKDIESYPPEQALNMFERYGLNYQSYEICRDLKTFDEVVDTLYDLVKHVEQANL